MPLGKRCGSTTMLPFASRETCQQSSITTYWYPASFIPDLTIASAIPRTSSSLTLQANLFQVFHPMGGVSAWPFETGFSCANTDAANDKNRKIASCLFIFSCLSQANTFLSEVGTQRKIKASTTKDTKEHEGNPLLLFFVFLSVHRG